MNAEDVQDALRELLDRLMISLEDDPEETEDLVPELMQDLDQIDTYHDASILTRDAGLVLRFQDGSEFQLTIIQSR